MTPTSTDRLRRDAHHRKRFSAVRLSSDTTATLPEYTSPRDSAIAQSWSAAESFEQPPDYPDSAEEADEETDEYVPLSPPISPRRQRRFRTSPRNPKNPYANADLVSASDTYLDSLLERSVHALELSNTLLQSSMSTQSSVSTALGTDSGSERLLESRARNLSSRIRNNRNVHDGWMDDLNDLTKGVESLYRDEANNDLDENAISRSLPTSGVPIAQRRNYRRPSLDLRNTLSDAPRLHILSGERLPSMPPPRALTQYVNVGFASGDAVESTADSTSIFLPSTIGLRAAAHVADIHPTRHRSSSPGSALHHLSSLAGRASSSRSSSPSSKTISRSSTPRAWERRGSSSHRKRSRSSSSSWSGSSNGPLTTSPIPRPFPPPIEEVTSPSDSSSSSDLQVFRTVECLKKILDEQPEPTDSKGKASMNSPSPRSHSFTPRSPPVAPIASTSNTTTSISRLLTKGTHSTSTRARSPPKHSSLKGSSSTLSVQEAASSHSRTSSGFSTPRQVAFGPLPESYGGSKGHGSSKFRDKKKGKSKYKEKNRDSDGNSSWWTTWLTGGSGLSMSTARHEERTEERAARSLGRPGMGGGLEEWAV